MARQTGLLWIAVLILVCFVAWALFHSSGSSVRQSPQEKSPPLGSGGSDVRSGNETAGVADPIPPSTVAEEPKVLPSIRLAPQFQGAGHGATKLEQALGLWFSGLSRLTKGREGALAISDDLLNQLYVRWHAKIFSLKEFYGDTAFANVEFSSIEMVLLRQLSADLATLPLFDFNSGEELEVRSAEFERSWPTPEFQREHAKTVQALTQWLEGELARCPDSVKRRYIMAVRSGYLIDAIEGFLTEDRGLVGKASSARTQFHVAIFKALTNLRTKGILADPMIENANPSTALEQLVGRYLRVAFAQPGHPFYASLDAEGELDPFYQRYKEYLKSGASLEEKALLDQIDAIYMTPDKSLIPPNDGSVKKDK